MKLQHTGQEQIAAAPATVWAFITDPQRIGECLPDVEQVKVIDPTHFDAVVRVGVGPVRGRFTMKFALRPDEAARRVTLTVSGGGFGSAVDMTAAADIVPSGGDATLLNWTGEAVMRGPVAAVGGRVLDAQAQKLISQTFATVRRKLSADRVPAEH